ncbi:hypothetical protein [Roseovarius sp. MMSF_3281]|uniref:hypothetical protein n=1 Tax=Roseovarius sp. MMSF_3281 TaxID=3046694 RepID=UPI00273F83FC|nr:hypothetical protein [Roseovarius sp. MMSF_3281]
MTLTLIHTAKLHEATFVSLRDRLAPGAKLHHITRPEWLDRARAGDESVTEDLAQAIATAPGPTLCTCTTLGATAESLGALRIDWPMMQAAAQSDGAIMLAYALDSTYESSLALLDRALQATGSRQKVHPLPLTQYWPLFEAGETDAFTSVIAGEIRQAAMTLPKLSCVVLAQASMAPAADRLTDMRVPVLASPELALRAALEI